MNEKIKSVIKNTLKDYTIEKIILFGSRAKGNYERDSDYDILVIINQDMSWEKREDISSAIRKNLAETDIDIDVLIRSSEYVGNAKKETGNVIAYAVAEGIEM